MDEKNIPDEGPLKVRPEVLKVLSLGWTVKVSHNRTYADSDEPIDDDLPGIKCGVCGSDNLILIFKDYYANLSGKSGEWEHKCLTCGKYTILDLND